VQRIVEGAQAEATHLLTEDREQLDRFFSPRRGSTTRTMACLAADQYVIADLERLLRTEVTGGDDLIAAAELIAIADGQDG
jgi:hypothetical protein